MSTTKVTNAAVLLWTACLAVGQAGLGDKKPGSEGGPVARVDKCVEVWQPTSAERRLDEIGWAPDLRTALRLAKENGRPVFLFHYVGSPFREHAIAQQRC